MRFKSGVGFWGSFNYLLVIVRERKGAMGCFERVMEMKLDCVDAWNCKNDTLFGGVVAVRR